MDKNTRFPLSRVCKSELRTITKQITIHNQISSNLFLHFLGNQTEKDSKKAHVTSNRAIQYGRREANCKQKDHTEALLLPQACPHPVATPSLELKVPKKMKTHLLLLSPEIFFFPRSRFISQCPKKRKKENRL